MYLGAICDDDGGVVCSGMQRSEVLVHLFSYGAIGRCRDVSHQNSVLLHFYLLRVRLIHASELHHMLVGLPEAMHCDYGEPVSSNHIGPQTLAPILQNQSVKKKKKKKKKREKKT